MKFKVFDIDPVPKPRQTRSARWKKTASDKRYYAFKDEIKKIGVSVPDSGAHVLFVLKMPLSWTRKKKKEMLHKPHKQRPDVDNMHKALLDSIFKDDAHVWDCRISKIWGHEGKIILITGIETNWIEAFLREIL